MRSLSILLLTLLLSANCFAQSNNEAILKRLNEKFLNALVNSDTAALSSVLASDFMLVNPGGIKRNKADNLATLLIPNQKVLSINIDSADIRMITGDVGIVSAWTTFVIEAGGKKTTGKNCYQDIYAKRNNEWKAVSAHVTMLSE